MAGKKKSKKKASKETTATPFHDAYAAVYAKPKKKKASKKKATRKAKAKKKVARKAKATGKRIGRPRKLEVTHVFHVTDINGAVTLGSFCSLDAAHDAIKAQSEVRLGLKERSEAEGTTEHTVSNAFTWTIVMTRAGDLKIPAAAW